MDDNPQMVAFRAALAKVQEAARLHRANAGLATEVAKVVGCSKQNVGQLIARGRPCPANWVVPLSRATGVARSALRPDLYPAEDDPSARLPARAAGSLPPAALECAGQLCIPGTERKRRNG